MAYTTRFGKLVRLHNSYTSNGKRIKAAPTLPYEVTPYPKDKGQYNGHCNRSACLRPGATWYNRGSYAFYCEDCALMLNVANRRDAYDLLGEGNELCIEIESAEEAATLHVMS